MIASVGSTIFGSERSSKRTSPGPYMTVPRIVRCLLLSMGSVRSLTSTAVFREDPAGDPQRRVCRRPAGIECQVRDQFDQFVLRDAVFERPFQMKGELVRYSATSVATVIKLRSRFDRPGRSQTSPNRTLWV
jgi:hypothetical protein